MVIVKSEFALALNQVASERGISVDDVLDSMRAAVLAALKKEHPELMENEEDFSVKIDQNSGEIKILKLDEDITPPGFGRIAAQTARQVVIQKIREAEKKTVISLYEGKVGSIVKGRITRYDPRSVYVDIGKAEAILPREEQIRNETYTVNDRLTFYIKEISNSPAGYSRIIISRAHPDLVKELFHREVPEIANETVEIKGIARSPGERTKIAVFSNQSGVDPVGACVGQKGVRVQTVTDELNGYEKIDIIQWNKDIKLYIAAALSPAQVQHVELYEEEGRAEVTVDEDQAPLAIGRNGVNVNLASQLVDLEIDIKQIASEASSKEEESETEDSDESEEKMTSEESEEAPSETSGEKDQEEVMQEEIEEEEEEHIEDEKADESSKSPTDETKTEKEENKS